jgi:hypothetical protein
MASGWTRSIGTEEQDRFALSVLSGFSRNVSSLHDVILNSFQDPFLAISGGVIGKMGPEPSSG